MNKSSEKEEDDNITEVDNTSCKDERRKISSIVERTADTSHSELKDKENNDNNNNSGTTATTSSREKFTAMRRRVKSCDDATAAASNDSFLHQRMREKAEHLENRLKQDGHHNQSGNCSISKSGTEESNTSQTLIDVHERAEQNCTSVHHHLAPNEATKADDDHDTNDSVDDDGNRGNDTTISTAALLELELQSRENNKKKNIEKKKITTNNGVNRRNIKKPMLSRDGTDDDDDDDEEEDISSFTTTKTYYHRNCVTVFQASPLVYIDSSSGTKHPFPLPDFEYEKQVLSDTLLVSSSTSGSTSTHNNNGENSITNAEENNGTATMATNNFNNSSNTNNNNNNGIDVELKFDIATVDRLSSYFLNESSSSHYYHNNNIITNNVLHFSAHGHPDYLAIENGSGVMQPLLVEQLREFVSATAASSLSTAAAPPPPTTTTTNFKKRRKTKKKAGSTRATTQQHQQMNNSNNSSYSTISSPTVVKVVFVSACYSRSAGQAFIDAGIHHVVCCHQNEQLRDTIAIEFAKNFYRALVAGKTLKQAFLVAKKTPSNHMVGRRATNEEMNKFLLLPEKPINDPYHDVHVFLPNNKATTGRKYNPTTPPSFRRYSSSSLSSFLPPLPQPPKLLLGREILMYKVISELHNDTAAIPRRLIYVTGEKGAGKSSLIRSVIHYIRDRSFSSTSNAQPNIAWVPSPFFVDIIDNKYLGRCESSSSSSLSDDNYSSSHKNNNSNVDDASNKINRSQDTLRLLLCHFQYILDDKEENDDSPFTSNSLSDAETASTFPFSNSSNTSSSSATTDSCQGNSDQRKRSFFRANIGNMIDELLNMNILIVIDCSRFGDNLSLPSPSSAGRMIDDDNNNHKRLLMVRKKVERITAFIKDIIDHTLHVKFALICPSSYRPSSTCGQKGDFETLRTTTATAKSTANTTIDESCVINVPPLSIRSSALLFGQLCPHVIERRCGYIQSSNDLINLLILPEYDSPTATSLGCDGGDTAIRSGCFNNIRNDVDNDVNNNKIYRSKRYNDIYEILGKGLPECIRRNALTISGVKYDELISIGERKECNIQWDISTRAELETEIRVVSKQMNDASNDNNFELAKELHDKHEELINLRSNRPSLVELVRLKKGLNEELQNAKQNNQYGLANNKQQELNLVKEQIEREINASPPVVRGNNDNKEYISYNLEQSISYETVPDDYENIITCTPLGDVEGSAKNLFTSGNIIDSEKISRREVEKSTADIENITNEICSIVHERLLQCVDVDNNDGRRSKIFPSYTKNDEEKKQQDEEKIPLFRRKWFLFIVLLLFVFASAIAVPTSIITKKNKNMPTTSPTSSLQPSRKPTSIPTQSSGPTLQPSVTPSIPPTRSIDLSVVIQLDDKPNETSWRLDCGEPIRNIANVPFGTYQKPDAILYHHFQAGGKTSIKKHFLFLVF